jgi:hypothetical protein
MVRSQRAEDRGQQQITRHYALSTRHFGNFGIRIADLLRLESRSHSEGTTGETEIEIRGQQVIYHLAFHIVVNWFRF